MVHLLPPHQGGGRTLWFFRRAMHGALQDVNDQSPEQHLVADTQGMEIVFHLRIGGIPFVQWASGHAARLLMRCRLAVKGRGSSDKSMRFSKHLISLCSRCNGCQPDSRYLFSASILMMARHTPLVPIEKTWFSMMAALSLAIGNGHRRRGFQRQCAALAPQNQ